MREVVSSVAEVGGGVAITVGCAQAYSPLGWVVGGVLAVVFSWRVSR